MQIIEKQAGNIIDRVFEYLGEKSYEYESKSMHRGMGKGMAGVYPTENERYDYIMKYLRSESLKAVFDLAAAQYLYPEFYHMLKELTGQCATLMLGLRLTDEESRWSHPQKKGGFEVLKEYLRVEKKAENFQYTELYADERLMLYLMGDDIPAEKIKDFVTLYFPEDEKEPVTSPYLNQIEKQMKAIMESEEKYLFQLCGENGRGKRRLLRALACLTGDGWVFVDYRSMRKMGQKEYSEAFWLICREAAFYGFGICFSYFGWDKQEELERFYRHWREIRQPLAFPVCVCTEERQELIPVTDCSVCRFVMPACTSRERIDIWKSMAEERQLVLDTEKYGSKYRLSPGDIRKIFNGLSVAGSNDMTEEERDILVAGLVQNVRKSPEKGSLKPVTSGYTMADLKLEPKQMETLENICAYIRYSRKVYDLWDMEHHFAYGKGVTALFCGPPGTGKSMAARVLSNELKMPLYRIDLSQVVDKYIGETEKRLEEIFTYAQNSNVILFFDEADSIFGKRTEVKESKDKYANTEVSYILQRIEEYDGMVLLATNLRNNIDEAFMRRMKYVVEFKLPDETTRKEIWKSGLDGKVELKDVDFDYLAQKIELSGGYIKNIILNALFLGAKDGDCVTMKHILESTCNEYQKLGKVMTPKDFEKYAYYLM